MNINKAPWINVMEYLQNISSHFQFFFRMDLSQQKV